MTAVPQSEPAASPAGEIVAKPVWLWYRFKWALMGLFLVFWGLYSIYDGFYAWPEEMRLAREQGLTKLPHSDLDVLLNKIIGIALPPLGALVLWWCFYNSRGEYRLSGDVLHVPGHPPVPLDAVQLIDKAKWDRKGIAYVEYQLPGGGEGRLKLDDYVYERKPTDDILDRIEAVLQPPEEQAAAAAAAAADATSPTAAEADEAAGEPEEQVRS